jgi:hypothetical protein
MLSGIMHFEEQPKNCLSHILVPHQAWIQTSGSSVS